MEKSHWGLQPLYWPNQPSGKTWTDHYIQAENRTLWPVSTPEANWHHGLCTLRLQRRGTDGPPHPPGLLHLAKTRDTSYGCRMSQTPTSCGEWRKTWATPPTSWQHTDWGSKHGWSTAEEEEGYHKISGMLLHFVSSSVYGTGYCMTHDLHKEPIQNSAVISPLV